MANRETQTKQPAQVPGDAESPPQGTESPAVKRGVERIDETEPVQSGQSHGGKAPG